MKKRLTAIIVLCILLLPGSGNGYASGTHMLDCGQIHFSEKNDEIVIASNGVANYAVYYGPEEGEVVSHAAEELALYLQKITSANFKVTTTPDAEEKLIVIGCNNPLTKAIENKMEFDKIRGDGFKIMSYDGNIYIAGKIDRGTLYGVYHFLDIYLGVRWFSPDFEIVPSKSTLKVCSMDDLQNPRFLYREIFSGDTDDAYFRQHNRLNGCRGGTHREKIEYPTEINTWSKDGPSGGNNFHDIISPEYHYGGQILAMNESVRVEASQYFINKISSEGIEPWYSFSQEDNGWDPDSESLSFAMEHGGSLSAPIVNLVENVSQRVRKIHPDAHLSTFAYQWSFAPPTGMTVPEYLMIEVAPIESDFGYPYSDEIHNAMAYSAFERWSQIAPSMSVWDYITNFQNYLQPWPNIYPMCENIKYFANLTPIKSYFGEGAYNTAGAEFSELRAWVASRLLWNPDQDYHALIDEFCDGYYGPASPYIKQYIKILHESFQNAGDSLSVKKPITSPYLNLDFIKRADRLMAMADAVTTRDCYSYPVGRSLSNYFGNVALAEEYSKHVHRVRLGIDMTILLNEHIYREEARREGMVWIHDPNRRARFEEYAREANITFYSEDQSIDMLYDAIDIERVAPPPPDFVSNSDEWVDFQDLDLSICCNAALVEDTKASDHGAVKYGGKEWAITLPLDMLPPGSNWTLYAYVRSDIKNSANLDEDAFNMGIGSTWISPRVSEMKDGEYNVFKFPGMPVSHQSGKSAWLSCANGSNYIYVDRIVAVKKVNNSENMLNNPHIGLNKSVFDHALLLDKKINLVLHLANGKIISVLNFIILEIVRSMQYATTFKMFCNVNVPKPLSYIPPIK